ncbi:MAG: hypothetical protein L6Q98_24145 [Anaerolineae bacterium]|nr:hypothetical protein [Anaerolineae bacterium]NUQ07387.1 hypothetical protein [Anaerolineae bacterium]
MTQVTINAINTAIAETLGATAGVVRVQDAGDLGEGLLDLPAIQVYWQGSITEPGGETDRRTFGAGVRLTRLTFYADVYARQRSHLGEDMTRTLALAVQTVLEAQHQPPFFGLAGVRALRWNAERVTFDYGGAAYAGVRFVIETTVY